MATNTYTNETGTYKPETRIDGQGNPYTVNVRQDSNVISSATMAPTPTVTVPPAPTDTNNYNGIIASGSTLIPPPVTEDPQKAQKDALAEYTKLLGTPPSAADAYNTAYNDTGIADKQKAVNDLSAQLASITAEGQQANLQLEQNAGGKDVTTAFLGRQQQEVSRQTAIKSLPIQAQLAAAQGNLALATDKLNTLFSLMQKDVETKYQYRKDLLDKNYNIMTAEQKIKSDSLQKENDRVYNLKIDQMNNAQTVANGLLSTQPQLAAQIGAIDWVKDPNALTKYNNLIGGVNTIKGGSGGGNSGANIITTSTGQQTDISPLNDSFSYAVTNFTKDQRNNAQTTYNGFINRGDVSGAEKYVEKLITDKLSSTQKDAITTMGTVETQIDKILAYNSDGKLEGVGFFAGPFGALTTKVFGTGSKEAQDVRALVGNIKGTIAKLRGGTSFTPNEEKLLESYTPTISESASSVLNKLGLLKDFISTQREKTLYPFGKQSSTGSGDNNSLRTKYQY